MAREILTPGAISLFCRLVDRLAGAFAIVVGLFISTIALGDDFFKDYVLSVIRNTPSVKVLVADAATGGCWTNPTATKALIEEKLLRSGIPVKSDAPMLLKFHVTGFSFDSAKGTPLGCAGNVGLFAQHLSEAKAPNGEPLAWADVRSFSRSKVLLGPKATFLKGIDDHARTWTTEFVVLWLKSRQQ